MSNTELFSLFETIIKEFKLKGELKDIRGISTGNINDTYLAVTKYYNGEKNYIIQRVNHHVFTEPVKIAENVSKVTYHIEQKLRERNVTDLRRRVLRYYKRDDGSCYYIDEKGNYWRVMSFVYGAVSITDANIQHLRTTGEAFGEFQNQLSDFYADTLYETIPDFHNTRKRYADLIKAAKEDKEGRLESVKEEYDYLMAMQSKAEYLCYLCDLGKLPLRVVHNDTKCNNVMFDVDTDEHLAVIDLDTVMPGLMAHDFGDAVRFAGNPGGEDNDDISKIYLDLDYYSAFVEGFVPKIIDIATNEEIESLPDSVLVITLELAARFLTDYLNGDVYFKCKKPMHNLIRTRAQIALAKDIDNKMPELRARLKCICDRIK
ncbi:MAG: aminoglycoside phosphotransferase family protein [Clostridia bacterium]|nr:aminoglycoside phosphotransferase family protein [Clostridia bacterium]